MLADSSMKHSFVCQKLQLLDYEILFDSWNVLGVCNDAFIITSDMPVCLTNLTTTLIMCFSV